MYGGPYLALPLLTGFLRERGIRTSQRDINIEVCNAMLSRDYLSGVADRIREQIAKLQSRRRSTEHDKKKHEELLIYDALSSFIIDHIEQARRALRAEHRRPRSVRKYLKLLDSAGLMISSLYYPSKWAINDSIYTTELTEQALTLEHVVESVYEDDQNVFLEFFRNNLVPTLMDEKRRIVGISVAIQTQMVPAFSLARVIKENQPEVHTTLGGPILPYIEHALMSYPRVFDLFDSAVVGEGEPTLLKLAAYVDGRDVMDSVPNILFLDESKQVRRSERHSAFPIEQQALPDFSDYDLSMYFSGLKTLPYLSARGCYWNRCAFCSINSTYGNVYRELPIERVVAELKMLKKKYGCKYVEFVDEVMSPKRLAKLAEALLARSLEIYWYVLARLEPGFTPEIMHNAYRAGCRLISWGLESGSQRTLDRMEKGTKVVDAGRILKQSHRCGIWNNAFIIIGFPGESKEDLDESLSFVLNNAMYIDSLGHTPFRLERSSRVFDYPEKFGIKIAPYPSTYYNAEYDFADLNPEAFNRSSATEEFSSTIVGHHFYLRNCAGYDTMRIIALMSHSPKLMFRVLQKVEAQRSEIRQKALTSPDRIRYNLKRSVVWTSKFALPTYDSKTLFRLGFDMSTFDCIILPDIFIDCLRESRNLGELGKTLSERRRKGTYERVKSLFKELIRYDFLDIRL